MQVKVSQAVRIITAFVRAGLVPMVAGSPGIGKSAIAKHIAYEHGLKVIDLRLSQADPTDLLGFPTIIGSKAGYIPMETFPIEGDEVPKGFNGWLLFLDEFNSATPAVQAAAYKLVLDRMVGVHNLHKKVAIICAGNLETDGAIVQPMSTALQSRLAHLELIVDTGEWVDWAMNNGVDHRITDYIQFKPNDLYTFSANHTDKTYGCPRTWEFVNRLIRDREDMSDPDLLPALAGTISEGLAREFITFCRIYDSLPKLSTILESPEKVKVPQEPSVLYALTGSLSHNADEANLDAMIKFIKRLPVEFQVVTLRDVVRRHKKLAGHKAVQAWVAESSSHLF